ncbi:MAG: SDR family oxidoreductase [Gammaproteobacteria bacterium]|nr:SDR family oxidoreductase [Gammaproteobacteria bacterium]MBU0801609.1 SDR family oxidoreductase [Alphaproteobacteria bacterium]MBU1804121.1 SDR family oxidoreductase [Gammaproteobacteria bacterium]
MAMLLQLLNMAGRVVLITGGLGHLGRMAAETLAELGADIVLLDLPSGPMEEVVADLRERYSVKVEYVSFDLEKDNVADVPAIIEGLFGRLDVLINNAAFVGTSNITGWAVPFSEQSVDAWRRAVEVNLTGVFALTQACAALLARSNKGAIVNISSIYGSQGPDMRLYDGLSMGNPAAYAASKGGVNQLTRWLATVLAPTVRVNAISPGGIFRQQPTEFCARYEERTPLQRMATEEDFKGVIALLASDASAYITGQNIFVDGGWGVW